MVVDFFGLKVIEKEEIVNGRITKILTHNE
jgi:hypothetical protein